MDVAGVADALIRGRQTKRGFLDRAVPLDTVREILSVARYAPSSSFAAPVGLIFTMDRRLERASFICYGCFLQNIMLAARARGLDTCPQQIWSLQYAVLREHLAIPDSELVVAGMSLGYADNSLPENRMQLRKLELEEFVSVVRA